MVIDLSCVCKGITEGDETICSSYENGSSYCGGHILGNVMPLFNVCAVAAVATAQNQDWDITKGEFLNNGDA